jgi:hypothetical protein
LREEALHDPSYGYLIDIVETSVGILYRNAFDKGLPLVKCRMHRILQKKPRNQDQFQYGSDSRSLPGKIFPGKTRPFVHPEFIPGRGGMNPVAKERGE